MKYLSYFLLFFTFGFTAFSQEIYLPETTYINYPFMTISFKNNEIRLWEAGTLDPVDYSPRTPERNLKGTYNLENIGGVNFINIQWENNQRERFLILYNNELCYLYKTDGNVYFRGFKIRGGAPGELTFPVSSRSTASSHLIEGNIVYSIDKLNERIGECWVEGVPGHGINETLHINEWPGIDLNSIHISIGFVSFNRPHLYNQNSRPKKIELSVVNKFSITVDLNDTPNFQTINLPVGIGRNDILVLKILEVYEGTRYEDTCINMLLVDIGRY